MNQREVERKILKMIKANNFLREENAKLVETRNHAMSYASHLFKFTMLRLDQRTDRQEDSDEFTEDIHTQETLTYETSNHPRSMPLNFTFQDFDNFLHWYRNPKNRHSLLKIDRAQEVEEKKESLEEYQYTEKLAKFVRAKRATRRKALAQKRETFIELAALENAAFRSKHESLEMMHEANPFEIVFKLPDGTNLSFEEYQEAMQRWDDNSDQYDVLPLDRNEAELEIDEEEVDDPWTVSEVRKREDEVIVMLPGGRSCTLKEFNDFRDHWVNAVNDAMDDQSTIPSTFSEVQGDYSDEKPNKGRKSRAIGIASLEAAAHHTYPDYSFPLPATGNINLRYDPNYINRARGQRKVKTRYRG